MTEPCISACAEKARLGIQHGLCRVCVIEKFIAAATYTFAFLDSCEWNDHTSETQAENAKQLLQDAIDVAEAGTPGGSRGETEP